MFKIRRLSTVLKTVFNISPNNALTCIGILFSPESENACHAARNLLKSLKILAVDAAGAGVSAGAGAGVGVSLGRIRAKGKTFRKTGKHGGLNGYLKQLSATVKGSNQTSRGGSATVNFPLWHRDIFELIILLFLL